MPRRENVGGGFHHISVRREGIQKKKKKRRLMTVLRGRGTGMLGWWALASNWGEGVSNRRGRWSRVGYRRGTGWVKGVRGGVTSNTRLW